MKVLLKDVVNSANSINILINSKMKAKLAFKFRKILQVVDENIELFNKSRQDLLDKFELKPDDKGITNIPDSIKGEVDKEFSELLEQEVDIDIPSIKIDDIENIELTPADLSRIYWIFDDK